MAGEATGCLYAESQGRLALTGWLDVLERLVLGTQLGQGLGSYYGKAGTIRTAVSLAGKKALGGVAQGQ